MARKPTPAHLQKPRTLQELREHPEVDEISIEHNFSEGRDYWVYYTTRIVTENGRLVARQLRCPMLETCFAHERTVKETIEKFVKREVCDCDIENDHCGAGCEFLPTEAE